MGQILWLEGSFHAIVVGQCAEILRFAQDDNAFGIIDQLKLPHFKLSDIRSNGCCGSKRYVSIAATSYSVTLGIMNSTPVAVRLNEMSFSTRKSWTRETLRPLGMPKLTRWAPIG
jgi:hypothetical protein